MAGYCFLFFAGLGMASAALAALLGGPILFLLLTVATILTILAVIGIAQGSSD